MEHPLTHTRARARIVPSRRREGIPDFTSESEFIDPDAPTDVLTPLRVKRGQGPGGRAAGAGASSGGETSGSETPVGRAGARGRGGGGGEPRPGFPLGAAAAASGEGGAGPPPSSWQPRRPGPGSTRALRRNESSSSEETSGGEEGCARGGGGGGGGGGAPLSPAPLPAAVAGDGVEAAAAPAPPAPDVLPASRSAGALAQQSSADGSPGAPATSAHQVVFSERWREKEARIAATSPHANLPGWRCVPVIVKADDDLRQEQFACQLIRQFASIFRTSKVPVWMRPYDILAITPDAGLIEAIPDTISVDSLKKNDPTFTTLDEWFDRHFNWGPRGLDRVRVARYNFTRSLAAYSIVCFILQIKDRHNGNILLDRRGAARAPFPAPRTPTALSLAARKGLGSRTPPPPHTHTHTCTRKTHNRPHHAHRLWLPPHQLARRQYWL
jgi:hypothetical protein